MSSLRMPEVSWRDVVGHDARATPSAGLALVARSAHQLGTLLVTARDHDGMIGALAQLFYQHGVKVTHSDHHVDPSTGRFFQRLRFDLSTLRTDRAALERSLRATAEQYAMDYRLTGDRRRRIAILVSKQEHCLYDLLARHRAGEMSCEVAMIVSNHPDAAPIARHFQIPFYHLPVAPGRREEQEAQLIELLTSADIELVVLARYMQILSPTFVDRFPMRIINIHHSFLPAFVGANPYRQAFEKGVKLIGATSHYVTADLDQGPIIEQETIRVTHRDSVEDLVRKGRDLEKRVLASALRCHLEDKVMLHDGKTVVFD